MGGELKASQLTGLNWLAYLWSKGKNGTLLMKFVSERCIVFFAFQNAKMLCTDRTDSFFPVLPLL